jgi:hypothetical protein
LSDWDPISGSPSDEYDCLVDKVISALTRGVRSEAQLADLILEELHDHFGLSVGRPDVEAVATRIVASAGQMPSPHA